MADRKYESIADFTGTYRGFSPSDESPIGMGEIEIAVTGEELRVRMATGLEIQTESVSTAGFTRMSREEIASVYQGDSEYIDRSVGFTYERGLDYLFLPEPSDEEFGLLVHGGLGDFLGPTILYSPEQLKRGVFEQALANIQAQLGTDEFPRLEYGGKLRPEN